MKNTVIKAIEENKIIAILRAIPEEKLIPLCEALYRGGIRLLEITYDASGKVSDEKTAELIERLAREFSGRLLIGAGTVIKTSQVELTKEAGGLFIISPNTSEAVIKKSAELGLVSIPGALTPSEIVAAAEYGADFVKLFPITSLGSGYVKAIKAPLSNIKLLAVGGIDEGNMAEYLRAGVCGFGIGSNITDKKMIEACDFSGIAELAKKYVEAACRA